MLIGEMNVRGCASVDYTLHATGGPKKKNLAFLYIGYGTCICTLGKQKMRFHYYIGLILKCNEIREKIRHLRKRDIRQTFIHTWDGAMRTFRSCTK